MTEPLLEDVCILARQAGLILREGYEKQHDVRSKGRADDPVTEIDGRSENFILDRLNTLYPGHTIITEETGAHSGDMEHCWYIDPLDGTMNYAHGIPMFCVSIGYAHKGELTMGVVYDPMRDECFSAEKGKGAFLNGHPIRCAEKTELREALFSTGFSMKVLEQLKKNNFPAFEELNKKTAGVRRIGVAALEICYVACGRLDGMWELLLCPWDVAAGFVIASEAGVKITDLDGNADVFKEPYEYIIANPVLHEKLSRALAPFGL